MKIKYELKGLNDIEKEFNKRLAKVEGYTAESITDITLDLLGKSVGDAPIDTGDLRGSGSARINNKEIAKGTKDGGVSVVGSAPEANKLIGEVGFSAKYALRQHEETNYSHPQGGKAKYLEDNFKNNKNKYFKHLEESIKKAIK